MEYFQPEKLWQFSTYGNSDGPWGHYAKWNKPNKEKYCVISLICGI